jgi:endonuclease/exonuclease/phosphatase family metal-dependent hydrolase
MRTKILIFFLLVAFGVEAQTINVMTYNIRFDNPNDGINQWTSRKQKVFDLIKKYDPDMFGVQEALHHQLEDIVKALPDYRYVGVGRDDGKQKGEYSALFYKTDKYDVRESKTFWLSENPTEPGSKSWDAAITRVVSLGKFIEKKSGRNFTFINTHFDHIGKEARAKSAEIIKREAVAIAGSDPVIITGDFNCARDEQPYKTMIEKDGLNLVDPAPENPQGTFCNFGVNSQPCRAIDYIFHTTQWKSANYKVIQDNDGKNYPSDHLPVMVSLTLK